MLQAITMDPVPTLSPQSFSAELCDFVNLMLQREPSDRATAASLLEHSFLETHQDTHRLVDMITVAPATSDEVRTILTKIVEYHSAASHIEGEKVESTVSFFGREKSGGGGYSGGGGGRDRWSPRYTSPPPLRKADVAVLAAQLQVTRTELGGSFNRTDEKRRQGGMTAPPSNVITIKARLQVVFVLMYRWECVPSFRRNPHAISGLTSRTIRGRPRLVSCIRPSCLSWL